MASHAHVIIDQVTDEPSPEDLEQLARSVAMSGVLGDRDRLDVVIALRRLAEIDKATRRHPANRRPVVAEFVAHRDLEWREAIEQVAAIGSPNDAAAAAVGAIRAALPELIAAMNPPKVQRVERDGQGRILSITTTAA